MKHAGVRALAAVMHPRRNAVAGPIDDAAIALADEAFAAFADRVEARLPGILAQNDEALRAIAIDAVTEGVKSADLGAAVQGAADEVRSGIKKVAFVTVVATSLLTLALVRFSS